MVVDDTLTAPRVCVCVCVCTTSYRRVMVAKCHDDTALARIIETFNVHRHAPASPVVLK